MSIFGEPNPLPGVAMGSPIYTRDYQKIGVVKDLSVNAFRVGIPPLHRDFWLPGRVIRSIASTGALILSIDKIELRAHEATGPLTAA